MVVITLRVMTHLMVGITLRVMPRLAQRDVRTWHAGSICITLAA